MTEKFPLIDDINDSVHSNINSAYFNSHIS